MWWTSQVERSAVPAGSSAVPPAGMRGWPGSGSTGLPAACSPAPGLSSAGPAAPWESPGFFSALSWRHRGGAWGNLLLPARGCQRPCPPLKRGSPALDQLCNCPLCLHRGRAGSGAMPGPIKPARGIKVSRTQLCLLDLTRPEGRFLQPEFTAP